jgi:hypothetical protein
MDGILGGLLLWRLELRHEFLQRTVDLAQDEEPNGRADKAKPGDLPSVVEKQCNSKK